MAGVEGIFGVTFWLIMLPILQIVPCDDKSLCQNGSIEDSLGAFRDYSNQPLHFLWSFCVLIMIPI